jgi:hypothetical protein
MTKEIKGTISRRNFLRLAEIATSAAVLAIYTPKYSYLPGDTLPIIRPTMPANTTHLEYLPLIFRLTKLTPPLPPEYTPPDYSSYYASEHYTTGQGIVSLRFDDTDVRNYTVIYPLLVDRNLKGGFAAVRSCIDHPNCMTLAQLLEMQNAGMEIMCHSMNHKTPPDDWYTFMVETEMALMQMREIGLNVCTFVTPGSWVGSDYDISSTDQYGNAVDAFLRRWFKVYMASVGNSSEALEMHLPRQNIYGAAAGFNQSLTSMKTYVDNCATYGRGMEMVCHVQWLDTKLHMTTADFIELLDYIAIKAEARTIVVKTPTAQLFATPV